MQLSLGTALELLEAHCIPFSFPEGISYLERYYYDTNLLVLYRELFPVQWQRSQLLKSDRALEFLELVRENLFPIHDVEDLLDYYYNTGEIYIISENADWWQYDIDEFGFGVQFLLSLMGEGFAIETWEEHFGFVPEDCPSSDRLDWERLRCLSREQPTPLCFLYDLVSLIDHSTGCLWLDVTEECHCSLPLTQETLLALARQWQVARLHIEHMEQFNLWLQSSLTARQQVVNLWNLVQKHDA